MIDTLLTGEGRIEDIPYGKLITSPYNTFEAIDIDDLAANIRYCGLITPLSVVGPNAEGNFEILSGERRYKAIGKIREEDGTFETVPCNVIGAADLDPIIKKIVVECANLETRNDYDKDAHRFTLIGLYHDLADQGTIEQQSIAREIQKALGVSSRYARMYHSIYTNATPELKAAVAAPSSYGNKNEDGNGKDVTHIPVSIASQIANLPEDVQKEMVKRTNAGEKASEVLDDYKGKVKVSDEGRIPADVQVDTPKFTPVSPSYAGPAATPGQAQHKIEAVPPEPQKDTYFAADDDDDFAEFLKGNEWGEEGFPDDEDLENFDLDDAMDFMRSKTKNVDLSLSTAMSSGELRLMQDEKTEAPSRASEWNTVSKWINRMLKVKDFSSLPEEEADLMQSVCELALLYQNALTAGAVNA